MHVCDDIAFTHVEKAISALLKCSEFKTEIDLDAAKSTIKMTDYFFLDDKTLLDYMSATHYAKSKALLTKAFDINLDRLQRFLPIIIVNKLTESELGKHNPLPLDGYLWEQATKYKLIKGGLESIEEQCTTLRSLDVEEQVRIFRGVSRNISKFKKSISKMVEFYALEDIQNLYLKSNKSLGVFRKTLLYQRNIKMVNRIKNNIHHPTFYAVGAAHLAGQKGMLNMLKQKGYRLKAIK